MSNRVECGIYEQKGKPKLANIRQYDESLSVSGKCEFSEIKIAKFASKQLPDCVQGDTQDIMLFADSCFPEHICKSFCNFIVPSCVGE